CFVSSRRRHTRLVSDWSSDVCSSDLPEPLLVTGVSTSAVGMDDETPVTSKGSGRAQPFFFLGSSVTFSTAPDLFVMTITRAFFRSEERRVGKECRSRWYRYHQKRHRD